MSKILTIVGRPNVGKSTFFNRIIGAREAIVHDEPGVTRDRHYGTTEWAGKSFTVIDTGGFVPNSTDLFEQAIREQAEIAIEEAHAIIFMVDATTGITPLDQEVADILRRSNKSVFLVVNKVDNQNREPDAAQFFSLGLGDPITISALGGRKIGDFLDLVTAKFSVNGEHAADEEDTRLKLAVVGKPNVGKSSLVNALLGKRRAIVTAIPGTTRDAIDSILKYHNEEIVLIDTAGLRRKSRIKESVEFYSTLRAIKSVDRCDVAILVVDISEGIDKQDLHILENIVERKRSVVLVANKWDLVKKDDQTAKGYEAAIKKQLRMYDFVPIIFVSALEKQRVYKLIELVKEVNEDQTKRISTNRLNNTMLKEIELKPPASRRGKEIKINYVTQVKTKPPAFAFFTNEPTLIDDGYKRFLENTLRKHFGLIGSPIGLFFRKKN